MLTDFQNSFTGRFSGKSATKNRIQISHHTLIMSLHYLVKYLCFKNDLASEEIEANCYVRAGGSVAEWLACWEQAQKGPGSNRSRDLRQNLRQTVHTHCADLFTKQQNW